MTSRKLERDSWRARRVVGELWVSDPARNPEDTDTGVEARQQVRNEKSNGKHSSEAVFFFPPD